MKRKSFIAAVMVLVLLCASSVCVALANGGCDHDNNYEGLERFTTESATICSNDSSCVVTTINTWYDIYCPVCRMDVGYAEETEEIHTGAGCTRRHYSYDVYWD